MTNCHWFLSSCPFTYWSLHCGPCLYRTLEVSVIPLIWWKKPKSDWSWGTSLWSKRKKKNRSFVWDFTAPCPKWEKEPALMSRCPWDTVLEEGEVWLWGRAIKTDELLLHYGKSLGQNDVEMNCCSAVFCAHYALFFPGWKLSTVK